MSYTMSLPEGSMLEHYRIERVLGQGGLGFTYLAYDTEGEKQVAIREHFPANDVFRGAGQTQVFAKQSAEEIAWMQEDFIEEAQQLAALDQPHIIKVLESFTANGTAYYVMNHIEGVSLADASTLRHSSHQWSEAELRSLLDILLGTLEYLHTQDIHHGDIKPENILVNAQLEPTLIDFALARQRYAERTEQRIESLGYTPIELLRSQAELGDWSDLYALGCTMYLLMTGERPAHSIDRIQVEQDPVEPLMERLDMSRYSLDLRKSIDCAMEVDSSKRWQSAHEWRLALAGDFVVGEQVVYKTSKLPWIITGGLAVLLAGAATAGLVYHDMKKEQIEDYEAALSAEKGRVELHKKIMLYMVEDNLDEERIRNEPMRRDIYECIGEAMRAEQAKDYPLAFRLYRQAAAQGDPDAQDKLGALYEKALDREVAYELAAKWYARAALRGSGSGMVHLAGCYEYGRGLPRSKRNARIWYQKCLETVDYRYGQARERALKALDRMDREALLAQQSAAAQSAPASQPEPELSPAPEPQPLIDVL